MGKEKSKIEKKVNMNSNQVFTINAKTSTLKYNSQENGGTILGNNIKYIIPIYQRPYSWNDHQIRKFISDIFTSYWGSDNIVIKEPMFIGTMQLTVANDDKQQEIIDGQQRLTTLFILLKVFKNKYTGCSDLDSISLDWLSTKVNSGKQQSYLEEVINNDLLCNEKSLNPYLINALKISEYIDEEVKDVSEDEENFEINDFIKYLISNIYFVVIETRAGLTKTLQIFNAINTTGLDLNGGDIFKIKMYEYLTTIKGKNENSFDEISMLYKKIDDYNAERNFNFTDINNILRIYQYILIARYDLPTALYSIGSDTFFERLFDTLFNTNQWDHFKNNISRVELSIEDLNRIIEVRYEWQKMQYSSVEDSCAMSFIWWSRYSKYWILNFVFLYKFRVDEDYWEKQQVFNRQLSKLYLIYSIRFLKAVNEMHTFTFTLIKTITNKSFDEVINTINNKIGKLENHKGWYDLENILNGNIAYNSKTKNLICRLSAMMEEDYKATEKDKIISIQNKLFDIPVDIEHIQSYHDKDGKLRKTIWDEWGNNINSLGNLMVLEQKINRSISNDHYHIKVKSYPTSSFNIVKNQVEKFNVWNLQSCIARKEKEVNKIINYLFEHSN